MDRERNLKKESRVEEEARIAREEGDGCIVVCLELCIGSRGDPGDAKIVGIARNTPSPNVHSSKSRVWDIHCVGCAKFGHHRHPLHCPLLRVLSAVHVAERVGSHRVGRVGSHRVERVGLL